jgi:hypothetical protein
MKMEDVKSVNQDITSIIKVVLKFAHMDIIILKILTTKYVINVKILNAILATEIFQSGTMNVIIVMKDSNYIKIVALNFVLMELFLFKFKITLDISSVKYVLMDVLNAMVLIVLVV